MPRSSAAAGRARVDRGAGACYGRPVASPVSLRTQEVRLALVLNGGVSLAIWMGGVVGELDRARRARGAEIVALDPVA